MSEIDFNEIYKKIDQFDFETLKIMNKPYIIADEYVLNSFDYIPDKTLDDTPHELEEILYNEKIIINNLYFTDILTLLNDVYIKEKEIRFPNRQINIKLVPSISLSNNIKLFFKHVLRFFEKNIINNFFYNENINENNLVIEIKKSLQKYNEVLNHNLLNIKIPYLNKENRIENINLNNKDKYQKEQFEIKLKEMKKEFDLYKIDLIDYFYKLNAIKSELDEFLKIFLNKIKIIISIKYNFKIKCIEVIKLIENPGKIFGNFSKKKKIEAGINLYINSIKELLNNYQLMKNDMKLFEEINNNNINIQNIYQEMNYYNRRLKEISNYITLLIREARLKLNEPNESFYVMDLYENKIDFINDYNFKINELIRTPTLIDYNNNIPIMDFPTFLYKIYTNEIKK